MTAKGRVHVFLGLWCVYTLAKSFTLPAESKMRSMGSVSGTLDKAASFDTCAATREVQVNLGIVEGGIGLPFDAEVVG